MKSMRQLFLLATVLCSLFVAMTISAAAANVWYTVDGVVGGQIKFNKDTGYVWGLENTVTTANIPSTIDGSAVTGIAQNSLYSSNKLTHVTIPASVTTIGQTAFLECKEIVSITVAQDNPYYCSIDGVLFGADGTELILYPAQKVGSSYTIPSTVTTVANLAFDNCTNLTQIIIPDSVTTLNHGAFRNCTSLTEINLPNNITELPANLFQHCESLEAVTIPASVRTIGDYAFFNCMSLSSMIIPDTVSVLGNSLFTYCEGLESVTLPQSMSSIPTYFFSGCTSLTEVNIPESVTNLNNNAFAGCSSLESITIPEGVTRIGQDCFASCSNLRQARLPSSLKTIAFNAFYKCGSLSEITLPEGLESIEKYVFEYCTSLKEVTIPSTATELSVGIFSNCTSLTRATILAEIDVLTSELFSSCSSLAEVTLPASVTEIGRFAFYDCNSLSDVYFGGTQAQWNVVSIETEYSLPLLSATIHYNGEVATTTTTSSVATLSNTKLMVNGADIATEAYLIDGNNYIKLRDLATMITGTDKQFEVTWNSELGTIEMQSGKSYTCVGGEMATGGNAETSAVLNASPIYLDGALVELRAYTINDNNYFKLRDVMALFDVGVGYNSDTATATLDTGLSYVD